MIEIETILPSPPAKVWEYLTRDVHLHKWWSKNVKMVPEKNGSFLEEWTDASGQKKKTFGKITVFEENIRLQMDWKDFDWPKHTRVEFLLTPAGTDGTRLVLQHSGWGIFDDKSRPPVVDEHAKGWAELMQSLFQYCKG